MKTLITILVLILTATSAQATSTSEICRTLNINALSASDVRVLAHNMKDHMDSDRGWKVMKLMESLYENWPWFGDYKDARTALIKDYNSIINYKSVDSATKAALKYSCSTYW